jgi:hypothetical protein
MGIIILAACNYFDAAQPPQSPDLALTLDSVRTEAVQTAEAELSERATSTFTIVAPTQQQTETATKTATDLPPTSTPTATATEIPPTPTATATATEIPPTPTATVTATKIPPTPTATATATKVPSPGISFLGVEKDRAVRVLASRFPPDQVFTVRVGPFNDFFKQNVSVGRVYSDIGGSFEFTIFLPFETLSAEMITVRLDSPQRNYAFNVFKNEDSGSVLYDGLVINPPLCNVSVSPEKTQTFAPRESFDAFWTVKNTSKQNWSDEEVDYEWVGGVEMHTYEDLYDIPQTVKPDETIKIGVDMLAPGTAGTYKTQWALVKGRIILCLLPLTVNVK